MNSITCPDCQADLDTDLIASRGDGECPFCGSDVSGLLAAIDVAAESTEFARDATGHGGETGELPLPTGSKINVVESSDDRLVIAIPPGGKAAGGMAVFAVVWNGFMAVFTGMWFFAGEMQGLGGLIIPLLIVGLFWAVGIGVVYAWLRMAFMTTYLLIERDRLVVRRILFGRVSTRETVLGENFTVSLQESYSSNDVPVHEVVVQGHERAEKFGTRLEEGEKRWLAQRIRSFVTGETAPVDVLFRPDGVHVSEAVGFGEMVPVETVETVTAAEIPADSLIVVEPSVDAFRFHLPLLPGGSMRTCAMVLCSGFSFVWLAITLAVGAGVVANGGGLITIAFLTVFALFGTVPLLIGQAFGRSRLSVSIDDAELQARWHAGPVGASRRFPLETITNVGLGTAMKSRSGETVRELGKACMLEAGGKSIPLTTFHEIGEARRVAGLVRHELERRGVVLPHV